MNSQDVQDVLALGELLDRATDASRADTIVELINWRDSHAVTMNLTLGTDGPSSVTATKGKAGKASAKPEPSPDPSADDEPGF